MAKVGRHLKAPLSTVDALRHGHFNLLTLANNHIMDFGAEALRRTRALCRDSGLDCVGAGENIAEAEQIHYHTEGSLTVGILAVTEHEFSIAGPSTPGANPLDPIRNFNSIRQAKQRAAHVIVIVHGGHEHYSYPSTRMIDTYRFFVDAGASAVIGHHGHCYSGFETYRDGRIFYGLGNFLFDSHRRDWKWTHGYAVRLALTGRNPVGYSIIPFTQGGDIPGTRLLTDESRARFEADLASINATIQDPAALHRHWDKYVRDRSFWLMRHLLPFGTRLNDLWMMLNLPLPISRQRRLRLLNMIRCESQRDALVDVLERQIT
jgi:poly-gamma-glutamate synthesis protein (capsule biosynthesis protein)